MLHVIDAHDVGQPTCALTVDITRLLCVKSSVDVLLGAQWFVDSDAFLLSDNQRQCLAQS